MCGLSANVVATVCVPPYFFSKGTGRLHLLEVQSVKGLLYMGQGEGEANGKNCHLFVLCYFYSSFFFHSWEIIHPIPYFRTQ